MVYVILLCGFSGPTSQLAVSVGNRVLLDERVTWAYTAFTLE